MYKVIREYECICKDGSKSKVPVRFLDLFPLEGGFAYKTAALGNCSKTPA